MSEITIAAVGDILINGMISLSAKLPGHEQTVYDYDPIFKEIAPVLQQADLTIGNLETPLSGNEPFVKKRNPATGNPLFNTPESLAPALKRAGFDVLSTANNHCLDNGAEGLLRTIEVLDEAGIAHTGTYASAEAARDLLIVERSGIRIGILSYTRHTNRNRIPSGMPWCVNLLDERRLLKDVKRLREEEVDIVIACLHDGVEYSASPTARQKMMARKLLKSGVDIILGTHPHVLQPIVWTRTNKLKAYSLGNLVSIRLKHNPYTHNGILLLVTIRKEEGRRAEIKNVDYQSTWVMRTRAESAVRYRIILNREVAVINNVAQASGISTREARLMRLMRSHTKRLMRNYRR
jgi:poly-gamma-glutamate capsule biosynthesis protein CapA/YwtB (metallophosphatase superfamily)